jgi:hypothetical protein
MSCMPYRLLTKTFSPCSGVIKQQTISEYERLTKAPDQQDQLRPFRAIECKLSGGAQSRVESLLSQRTTSRFNTLDLDSESETSSDSESDSSSQSPYDYNPLTKVHRRPGPLGEKWTGRNIIILSPSSTASPSPTSEVSETTQFFSNQPEEPQQQPLTNAPLNIPSVTDWVTSLHRLIATHASFTLIYEVEQALLNHLHTHPATLTDVQSLIPSLSFRHQITHKLATKIGLYHARGAIPESVVEEMLIHMLTHDAPDMMARTRDQIARFRQEREACALYKMNDKQRRQYALN